MMHSDDGKPERDLSIPEDGSIPDFLKRKPGNIPPWGNEPITESVPMRTVVPVTHAPDTASEPAADAPKGKGKGKGKAAPKGAAGKGKAPAKAAANGNGKAAKAAAKPTKAAAAKGKGKAAPKAERTRDPAKLDQFGFRKDSIKSRAAAMYATKKGATLEEVKEVVGSVQFNLLTELKENGFKVETDEVKNSKGRMVTRYKLHPKA